MQRSTLRLLTRRSLLVPVSILLVHAVGGTKTFAAGRPKSTPAPPASSTATAANQPMRLPTAVQDMLDLIQSAIAARRIDDLKDAIDWNEMKPDFGPTVTGDPVTHWKQQSQDGTGQATLDLLAALLDGRPATVPYGRDLENNRLYVWPHFTESGIANLAGAELEQFNRLVAIDQRDAMLKSGRYAGWRLALGPDGTWHTFRQDP